VSVVFARQQLGTGAIKSVDPERGKEVAALSYGHRVSIQTRKAVERLPAKQALSLSRYRGRWFKSGLRNQSFFSFNNFRKPCNHPN